ncbi:hypothetical protein MNEG_2267 [Monoraphidium neglectum]|uniref:Uncharacterized protein n=1 Tax=Monoraphidium neglectum TaxID=145388 RepID=A0A0D2MT28_9CHLO|nr:hypothetical protein MNEG_2267 [Monoraphidium neglectum]KIZ05690.1 hypothetical protein MNEG_2267 [Monoraphidium neglectum]|eukprot:XP_013904709.1 hypothetical protein MNEG_2267 [Monoraphidium neglectum]
MTRALCGALVVLPWTVLLLLVGLHSWHDHGHTSFIQAGLPGAKQCVGWRETYFCHPFAERYGPGDKGCDDEIMPQVSGYCLCEGNVTTARVTCGPKRFTCRQKCAELAYNPTDALAMPAPITCPYDVPYLLRSFLKGIPDAPADWSADPAKERTKVAPLWEEIQAAVHAHGVPAAVAPGTRNTTHDFVREGSSIPRSTVEYVRSQLAAYSAAMPTYPRGAFSGAGVVTVGGGMRYIIPAWIMVHQLRHTGCKLPIEMWYPISEWPPQAVVDAFAKLGVTSRKLDFRGLNITAFKHDPKAPPHDTMARFTIKVAAILLSRFQEVIYLDADNIPLKDPAHLLDGPEYNATGALLWQDFWDNTVAPEAEQMLGVPRSDWFRGSFESGQMVVDKARHWRGLLTAAWLNSYASFWYEVFTCFLGKGDKETFAYGMAAAREPYYVITTPPGSLGTTGTSMSCNSRTHLCKDEFTGNTMVQYDTRGAPLFLHSNLHKWDMRLPEKFSLHYQRRWQVLLPGPVHWEDWMRQHLGHDLEHKVYEWIRMLRCMPWWDAYYQERLALGDRKTPDLDGFHYLLRGIELPKLYRAGWTGNYQAQLQGLSFGDWRNHAWNLRARPKLAALGLAQRWDPARDQS